MTQESVKKFQFFNQEYLTDQKKILNEIEITDAFGIGNIIYFSDNKKNKIYFYANNSVYDSYQPYSEELLFMKCNSEHTKFITYGIDNDHSFKHHQLKIWDPSVQEFQSKKPKKVIETKIQNYTCFGVTNNFSGIAFGQKDGKIVYFYSKNQTNLEYKEGILNIDQEIIRSINLTRQDQIIMLYYTTDTAIHIISNFQSHKRSFKYQGGNIFDITFRGTLIGCPNEEHQTIIEVSDPGKRNNSWLVEGKKLEIKRFQQHYIAIQLITKSEKDNSDQLQLIILDYLNGYIAFYKKYENIHKIIASNECLYIIIQTSRGEKSLIKFTEKDNTHKIETFFKNNYYDVMYTFAQNQNSDESILSEICRLHGDHLYQQHDLQESINKYMQTTNHLEPSYVIGKFLDVSQVEYLIQYLEKLHQNQQVDKHHTALLLNSYIKLKQMNKFIEKIEKYGFESELFDIKTAIKECRQTGNIDIALMMSQSRQIYSSCLQIWIFDKLDFTSALEYIKDIIILEEKTTYLKEFGLELMKSEPKLTLEIVSNFILFINIITNLKKEYGSRKGIDTIDKLNPEQQILCKYFKLNEIQLQNIFTITFPKPDEFFYLFTGQSNYFESYLKFLIENCKNLPGEIAIFHRYFEHHLEQYEIDIHKESSQQSIMKLLLDDNNEKKYDKNHLLVQFKIYKFTSGIIFLLRKLQMREELLNFYMLQKDNQQIINLCSEYGEEESNLWIQALKYFIKPQNNALNFIPAILQEIQRVESISPLIIVEILKENKNVKFGEIKNFLKFSLSRDLQIINQNTQKINENMKIAQETRQEYKKLKTQAKIFSFGKCASCENPITLPSFHFLCGHSYHENCINIENQMRVCMRCQFDTQQLLGRQQEINSQNEIALKLRNKLLDYDAKYEIIKKYK